MADLIHDLILSTAQRVPNNTTLSYKGDQQSYGHLAAAVLAYARSLTETAGLERDERVAVYLEKRPEAVVGLFGAAAAGGVFVPVNPLLKPPQVGYILRDCNVRVLVTSASRLEQLGDELSHCHDLHTVVVVDGPPMDP
ncbi:AMP-binding protein, partial [Aquisalimonas sp.]|uniref:AMP-binding protein n=1 Tax=Aquisalimonas sp. TaxID=1872621 RepID=UPI0025C633C3